MDETEKRLVPRGCCCRAACCVAHRKATHLKGALVQHLDGLCCDIMADWQSLQVCSAPIWFVSQVPVLPSAHTSCHLFVDPTCLLKLSGEVGAALVS